jgi:DNA invertase Pin-like site-specific DNA recombinase
MLVGYARVSTTDQDLTVQLDALKAAGCERVFSEKVTGTSTVDREELRQALAFVREGDVLLVTRLDRLARSMQDLVVIVADMVKRKVDFRCLQQAAVDTTNAQGRLMLNMLGAFAEFDNDLRRERQREGIDKAKTRGVYTGGRPKVVTREAIQMEIDRGVKGASDIAKRLGVSRSTVYRRAPDMFGGAPEWLSKEA